MIEILAIYGTRPEAIKMAPVIQSLHRRANACRLSVCVTAQHRELLDQVHELFSIEPDLDLNLMQHDQALNDLTARGFSGLDRVLTKVNPDWVLVQGDTTTALVAAMASFHRGTRVAHIEAGLRTGNLRHPFPEEFNRRVIDLAAEACFAPTRRAVHALRAEGVAPERIHLTGNTVVDALESIRKGLPPSSSDPEVLITVHRRESFGSGVSKIFEAIRQLAQEFDDIRWIYPVHPNPRVRGPAYQQLADLPNVELCDPFGYLELIRRLNKCRLVLTDSGGIQEEAPAFGKPVLVLRETTERPEGIDAGVAELVGVSTERIVETSRRLLTDDSAYARMASAVNPYGDGLAAERIASCLLGEPWSPFGSESRSQKSMADTTLEDS